MNKWGAIAGMAAGITFTLAYIIYFQFGSGTADQYLFGITPEGIGFLGMILNFLVAFIVCFFTPPPPKDIVVMVERIRIPQGAGSATHH